MVGRRKNNAPRGKARYNIKNPPHFKINTTQNQEGHMHTAMSMEVH